MGSDAERAVLGACMYQVSAVRFAAEVIDPMDFSHPSLGQLFNLIAGMRGSGAPVDSITISRELRARKFPGIEVPEVVSWIDFGATAANVKFYAQIVRDDSVRRQVAATMGRGVQKAQDAGVEPATIVADTMRELAGIRDGQQTHTLEAKLLRDVMLVQESFDWVIPGLLERRDRVVVTAGEGAGKTTFIRQMAVASASGVNPITFQPIDPIRVLVVDAENSEKQWKRQVSALVTRGRLSGSADPAENVWLACSPRLNIVKDSDLGAIHRLLDESGADLVCIGPLYRLIPGNVNSEDEVAPILAALDTIRDRGVAMVIEAHAGHSKNSAGSRELRPRGSSALMGWPEFGFGLAIEPTNPEILVNLQRWRGDREQRDWPAQFMRGGPWPWTDSNMLDHVRREAFGRTEEAS